MGVVVALTAIGRSISPLWCKWINEVYIIHTCSSCDVCVCLVDAAYEGLMKRTFVAMLVLMATHLPFLTGIVVMYRKLGFKPTKSAFSDSEEVGSKSDPDSVNEDNY